MHLDDLMRRGLRMEDPHYAYSDDTDVLQMISILACEENFYLPEWEELDAAALQALKDTPLLHRSEWHQRDLFQDFIEDTDFPPAFVDQMAAAYREYFDIKPQPFKENSPFNDLIL
jgi:hypothetical protein